MSISSKKENAIPDDDEILQPPTVEVDGQEFKPFTSDGEFWAMLDAIEEKSVREYEEKTKEK